MVSEVPAVVAGLAVGIALIVAFSLTFKPTIALSDEEILSRLKTLPEVQNFYEVAAFSNLQPSEEVRHDRNMVYVDYALTSTYTYDDGDPTTIEDLTTSKELRLYVTMNQFGNTVMELACDQNPSLGVEIVFHATAENILKTECLERP